MQRTGTTPLNPDGTYGRRNDNVNQMNQAIIRKQAPNRIIRVDQADVSSPNDAYAHVHFKDGSALTEDGRWKHGGLKLRREEEEWIQSYGWTLPQ